jgi:hypothetical protein
VKRCRADWYGEGLGMVLFYLSLLLWAGLGTILIALIPFGLLRQRKATAEKERENKPSK